MAEYQQIAEGFLNDNLSEEGGVWNIQCWLTRLVQQSIVQHPSVGHSFVCGVIRSQGYMVTRECVQQAIRSCDPVNTALRWGGIAIPRQPYGVPGPKFLWHIGR